ncbi:RNA polymerase sigma factor [Ferruginibacter albus]|uniref:RNA polymerase sigma factor n=1 Tax=Ferruginibacter albus TaxID=2875540 RepID=UPI001CC4B574|nr:sigma-70 family RNA polymerase sigma factor [Ferruginibacter albus]UAY52848.1 sigma-70 family RNA polymerase sigma factor [Ferruginibacter albus]
MRTYTEEELIACLQQNDKYAFSYLYDNYAPALNGIIIKVAMDKTISEDILQEVFIKIWNNFSSYDSFKGRLFTWMAIIARNTTIDYIKSKHHQKQYRTGQYNSIVMNIPYKELTNFDIMFLRKHVVKLKPLHSTVLHKFYFEGYTHQQVSKEIGKPLGTVKTILRSGVNSLKNSLNTSKYSYL